jgi:cbb3-type cytochrome oxidase subunit 3
MPLNMNRKIFSTSIAMGLALLAKPAALRACAVCFGDTNDPINAGFNASVLFLMATPYMVMTLIAGGLFWAYRRARKQDEQAESSEPVAPLAWNQEESGR